MDTSAAMHLMYFFPLLVFTILVALAVFAYASHSLLLVVINSAAGNEEVLWPDEPYLDWVHKVCYLLWLLAVWTVPTVFLLWTLALPRHWTWIGAIAILWLVYPVSLLSALSGASMFVILRLQIVGLFFLHFGLIARLYFLSAILLAACGGLAFYAETGPVGLLVLPAAFAGSIGMLIYARLLGRVGWIISLQRLSNRRTKDAPPEGAKRMVTFDPWAMPDEDRKRLDRLEASEETARARKARQSAHRPPAKKKRTSTVRPSEAVDPWAVPQDFVFESTKTTPDNHLVEDEWNAQGRYALQADDAWKNQHPAEDRPENAGSGRKEMPEPLSLMPLDLPWPSQSASEPPGPTIEGYKVENADQPVPAPPPAGPPEQMRREEELAAPKREPDPPAWPLVEGVYSFPFQASTVPAMLKLALSLVVLGTLVRLVLSAWPTFV